MGLFKRNKRNIKKTIRIQCPGSEELKFEAAGGNPPEKYFICRNNKTVMAEYKPVIRLYGLSEDNIRFYEEAFAYLNSEKDSIEKELKAYFLESYERGEIDEKFSIMDINESTRQIIAKEAEEAAYYGDCFTGYENIQALLANSKETDIFFEVVSSIIYNQYQCSEEYATAYINWRTKEKCYSFDVF